MGELTFFLGLQVKQKDDEIFISLDKYVADILKKFDFTTMKTVSTPIETNKALLKDEEAEDVDVAFWSLRFAYFGHCVLLLRFVYRLRFVTAFCLIEDPLYSKSKRYAAQISTNLAFYETIIKEWEDRMERAATTASSLEAEQDSDNINRTQSMTTLNESFPQGTDSGSGPRCQDTILGV
ncbi:uncharacterized mitochondrial protein-like protein [Tanacetum coccineum]|uniref:Uncharacterized mitochondrial protein-like protein n=1 Tax=Tanacetum coccineum TaxID=301880 RepID=A0ABQ5ETJ8_9ASTR